MPARFNAVRWPRQSLFGGFAVDLHAAHPQTPAGRVQFDLLFFCHRAGDQCAGHHGAEPLHGKRAVEGQPEMSRSPLGGHGACGAAQRPAQLVKPCARHRTDRHHRRVLHELPGDELLHLQPHEFQNVGVHQIGLRQRHHALRNSQQSADIEMLAGLRLNGFVGRDREQHQVDAADAGQHVFDEALVARHVHETQPEIGRQLQVREADIDRNAAPLLLFQAVSVDARECFHERGFAVVDVAGRAHDDVLHALMFHRTTGVIDWSWTELPCRKH